MFLVIRNIALIVIAIEVFKRTKCNEISSLCQNNTPGTLLLLTIYSW